MLNAIALRKSIEAWAKRHWALLGAFGHALAFAVLFGGVALAAYTSGFAGTAMSALCGAMAVLFVRHYVRLVPRAQRLIDRLQPPESPATPEFPNWALAIYALIGLALILLIIAHEDSYTYAAMELFVGWAAGHDVLKYLWARQTRPETPKALDIIDDLAPSSRGELEITDVNREFARRGELHVHRVEGWWHDGGKHWADLADVGRLIEETGSNR